MKKSHDVSTNRFSAMMSTDNTFVLPTAIDRQGALLKRNNTSDPQSKLKKADKTKLSEPIPISRKRWKGSDLAMSSLMLKEMLGHVSPETMSMEETDERKDQERSRHENLLLRYSLLKRIPVKEYKRRVKSTKARFLNVTRKNIHASRNPMDLVNQICDDSQQLEENELYSIYYKHLQDIARTRGIENKSLPNLRTFHLDEPKPLKWDFKTDSNASSLIKKLLHEDNQHSQLGISKSLPVYKGHTQVSSRQKTLEQHSEAECAIPKPGCSSEMASGSEALVGDENSADHQDSSMNEKVVDESIKASYVEQNVLSEHEAEYHTPAVSNAMEIANTSSQPVKVSMKERPSIDNEVTKHDVSLIQKISRSSSDDDDNSTDIDSEEILPDNSNTDDQVDQVRQPFYAGMNQVDNLEDQFYDLFQRMKVTSSETCEMAKALHKSLLQAQEVIDGIATASMNLRKLSLNKVSEGTSKEVTAEIQQIFEDNQAVKKIDESPDGNVKKDKIDDSNEKSEEIINENDNDNSVVDDDKDNDDIIKEDKGKKVTKKTSGNIRTFVLPPEYDPNDSRWTLKHRENNPQLNLVELFPHSNVFINSIKLAHCKREAKDSKALGRMLLMEVFSLAALSVCSLTGARSNVFHTSVKNVRPGLDERARMAILSFVEKHAGERKWGPVDSTSVMSSLRSKIQDVRAKHGKTT